MAHNLLQLYGSSALGGIYSIMHVYIELSLNLIFITYILVHEEVSTVCKAVGVTRLLVWSLKQ